MNASGPTSISTTNWMRFCGRVKEKEEGLRALLCSVLHAYEEMRPLLALLVLTTHPDVLSLQSIRKCPLNSAHSAGTH